MSSRWSYGPDGLRERPVTRWSDAVLPRWRDVQPLLIRSAGVVGIVATIMAVVSSDAWRFGSVAPSVGRNDPPADIAAPGDTAPVPVVFAASEPGAATLPEPAAPVPVKAAAAETSAAQVAAIEMPAPAVPPDVVDLRAERVLAPVASASAPLTTASVSAPVTAPSTTASVPAPERVVFPAAISVASAGGFALGNAPAPVVQAAPVETSLIELRASDPPASGADPKSSAWAEDSAACPRDWVAADAAAPSGAGATDCIAAASLDTPAADADRSALEAAAAEEALKLAALAPRVPAPRPDPPADLPKPQPVRVRHASDWPDAPPPNCGSGQRAKWHFVDRKARTKEWYCR